jgi:hypothetical protein
MIKCCQLSPISSSVTLADMAAMSQADLQGLWLGSAMAAWCSLQMHTAAGPMPDFQTSAVLQYSEEEWARVAEVCGARPVHKGPA